MRKPHPDLVRYIEQKLERQYPVEDIKKELIDIGHDIELVEASVQHVMKKRRLKSMIVIGLLLVGMLLLMGLVGYLIRLAENPPSTTTTTTLKSVPLENLTGSGPGAVYANVFKSRWVYVVNGEKMQDGKIALKPGGYLFYGKPLNVKKITVNYFVPEHCTGEVQLIDDPMVLKKQPLAGGIQTITYEPTRPVTVFIFKYQSSCDKNLIVNLIDLR